MTADSITLASVSTIESLLEIALDSVRNILTDPPSTEDAAAIINDAIQNLVNANS